MTKLTRCFCRLISVIAALISVSLCNADPASQQAAPLWVTGYYLSGDSDTGRYPVSQIDFHALTDMIDFANFPGPGGTLDPARTITAAQSAR